MQLFQGDLAVTPSTLTADLFWEGAASFEVGNLAGGARAELIWRDGTGHSGVVSIRVEDVAITLPAGRFLLPPSPNPLGPGELQAWPILIPSVEPFDQ